MDELKTIAAAAATHSSVLRRNFTMPATLAGGDLVCLFQTAHSVGVDQVELQSQLG
jgi:hypothetical protein